MPTYATPEWIAYGTAGSKTHLVARASVAGTTAFCGIDLAGRRLASVGMPRCKQCLDALVRYTADALEEPPARVTEKLFITCERNSDSEPLLSRLQHYFRHRLHESYRVDVVEVFSDAG